MEHGFVTFIDEAGDEGFGNFRSTEKAGQTHWLVLAGLIIDAAYEGQVVRWRNQIRDPIESQLRRQGKLQTGKSFRQDIHFRDLNHEQRTLACHVLSRTHGAIVGVLLNKTRIPERANHFIFRERRNVYFYMVSQLLELVGIYCQSRCNAEDAPRRGSRLIFSKRESTNYNQLKEFLTNADGLDDPNGMRGSVDRRHVDLDSLTAEAHTASAGLQLADVTASALFKAVEPNIYGLVDPSYAELLGHTLDPPGEVPYLKRLIKILPRRTPSGPDSPHRRLVSK